MTTKTLHWEELLTTRFTIKSSECILAKCTFKNWAAAVGFIPNLVEIHQTNSGNIMNLNIKCILFYVIGNTE